MSADPRHSVGAAVVLVSGGLDSATTLAIAQDEGFDCHALAVDYGQRHAAELDAARRVADAAGAPLKVVHVDLRAIGGSALTDDIDVPTDSGAGLRGSSGSSQDERGPNQDTPGPGDGSGARIIDGGGIPVTYVPARNTILLSLALGYAEVLGSSDIFIGVNAVDYSGYPDCRPEFIAAFESMARLATRAGVEDRPARIHTPLIDLTKANIIRRGVRLGVDYALTVSCYQADEHGRACGDCDSCRIRRQGFEAAEIADPTTYRGKADATA